MPVRRPTFDHLIRAALAEDLGPQGRDVTSEAIIPKGLKTIAVMRSRKPGIVSGVDVAAAVFKAVNSSLKIKINVTNGDKVIKNQHILTVSGPASSILKAERVALNFICHLSGIATLTRAYVDAVKGTRAKILDTRKTIPGLRILAKQAVSDGGGVNHRIGLYDAILIKDNHLEVAKSIKVAINEVHAKAPSLQLIVEVDTLNQLAEILLEKSVNVALLDNMNLKTLRRAVAMVKATPKSRRPLIEASGGVNLKTVRAIAKTGVDRISVGALTHSAPILDIGLDIRTPSPKGRGLG